MQKFGSRQQCKTFQGGFQTKRNLFSSNFWQFHLFLQNHLFVVYGIMNSVIYEEKSSIDICVYNLEKAFDALWIEDCLNDLHDTLPEDQHDDKLALVYESNRNNMVAVKKQWD